MGGHLYHIMRKYIYFDVGNTQPFDNRKHIAPIIIAAAIAGASALAAAGASYKSAKNTNKSNQKNVEDTNEANLLLNKQTNDANLQLAREQNTWNEEMYNKYDSPTAKKNQLLAAGYNPLYTDAATGANLQSANLANQVAPSLQAPQADPNSEANALGNVVTAAGNAVQNYYQALQTNSQIKVNDANIANVEADTYNKGIVGPAQASAQYATAAQGYAQQKYYDKQTSWIDQLNEANISEINQRTQLEAANTLSHHAQSVKTLSEKEFIDKQKEWYDSLTTAQISSLRSGAAMNYATVNQIASLLPYQIREKEGVISQLQASVTGILLDNSIKTWEDKQKAFDTEMQRIYGIKNNGGMFDNLFGMIAKGIYEIGNTISPLPQGHINNYSGFHSSHSKSW